MLGRINPGYFCGGEVEADMDAASARSARSRRRSRSPVEAARGILRIANSNMINALKLVSVNRGHDPRDFALVCFGGGGGLHAVDLARELGIETVVVPRASEVFSAWGMLMSDLRRDAFVTRLLPLGEESAPPLAALVGEVCDALLAQFAAEGIDASRVRFLRYGNLRYENQEHGVEVPLPEGRLDVAATRALAAGFHAAYEREYTYRLDAPVELVGIHVVAHADVGRLAAAPVTPAGRAPGEALKGRRRVDFVDAGSAEAGVYDAALLDPGAEVAGPAVVESSGSTVVVPPGAAARLDGYGNLVLDAGAP